MTETNVSLTSNSSTLINNLPNPGAYIDQVISLRIVRMLEGLFEKFNWKSLIILLGLAGAEEGKKIIISIIQYYKKYISENYKSFNFQGFKNTIFNTLKDVSLKNLFFRRKEILCIQLDVPEVLISEYIEFKPTSIFWKNLYGSKFLKYNIVNTKLEQVNKNEYILTETWNNIEIVSDLIKVSLDQQIDMTFDILNGCKSVKSSELSITDYFPPGKDLFDLIPERFNGFKKRFELLVSESMTTKTDWGFYNLLDRSGHHNKSEFSLNEKYGYRSGLSIFFDILHKKLKFKDPKKSRIQLIYFINNIYKIDEIKDHKKLFGVDISEYDSNSNTMTCGEWPFTLKCKETKDMSNWFWAQVNPKFIEDVKESNSSSIPDFLQIKITETKRESNLNLIQEWQRFVIELGDNDTIIIKGDDHKKSKVKVYDIRMVTKTKKHDTITPNFSEKLENSGSSGSSSDSDLSIINVSEKKEDFKQVQSRELSHQLSHQQSHQQSRQQMSRQQFEKPETEIIKEIQCEYISSTRKDFSTLYLKQKDEILLKGLLDRFKNREDLFERLGIPYKLGILLHGVPGGGKSSTITAIATELQAPIYYMDLKNVKTNEDLKKLWKYVNQADTKNGIIVLEDIDAMTDIIFKRTEIVHGNEGDLTYDCILNLMQGSLTEYGSVFIVTTNHLEKIDPAFYRAGRFDLCMELTECDHYQIDKIYKSFFEKKLKPEILELIPEGTIIPSKIIHSLYPYVLNYSDEEIIFECIKGLS